MKLFAGIPENVFSVRRSLRLCRGVRVSVLSGSDGSVLRSFRATKYLSGGVWLGPLGIMSMSLRVGTLEWWLESSAGVSESGISVRIGRRVLRCESSVRSLS